MAQPVITVKDASGVNREIFTANQNGQGTMANSQPVTLASDQPAIPVSTGGLTDAQLRATPVPVSTGLSQGLTDTQLRATPLALPTGAAADGVDGTGITPPTGASGIRGWLSGIYQKLITSITVTGPVTNTELRASPINVAYPLAAPITGQIVIAVTGTRIALPSNVLLNGVVIKAKSDNNSAGGFVGGATVSVVDNGTGPGFKLSPGEAISISVANTNSVYVNGTAGDIFYFAGN